MSVGGKSVKRNWVIAGVVVAALLVGGTLALDRMRRDATQSGTGTKAGTEASPSGDEQSPPSPKTDSVPLKRVTAPPARTLAFIDAKQFSADSTYDVTFVPYGTGPGPMTLVVSVKTSKPIGTVAKPFDFAGQNVMLSTGRLPADKAVAKGGTYRGRILLAGGGDVLTPTLVDVTAK
jgi:hypothetical protein